MKFQDDDVYKADFEDGYIVGNERAKFRNIVPRTRVTEFSRVYSPE